MAIIVLFLHGGKRIGVALQVAFELNKNGRLVRVWRGGIQIWFLLVCTWWTTAIVGRVRSSMSRWYCSAALRTSCILGNRCSTSIWWKKINKEQTQTQDRRNTRTVAKSLNRSRKESITAVVNNNLRATGKFAEMQLRKTQRRKTIQLRLEANRMPCNFDFREEIWHTRTQVKQRGHTHTQWHSVEMWETKGRK